ncbi:CENPC protein, partial [Rhinopomastus cyanomelas]|nr:CENPC protein [Rhinopomastus cyanomelas]
SEKEKTETKKRKVQVEALSKQQTGCVDTVHDLVGTPDPVANTGGKVLKSQRRSSTRTGKPKKGMFRQGSPHQKKDVSQKPEAEELMLAQTGLNTEVCEAELCKTKVMPNKDLPVPSPEHQQECVLSPVKSLKSSKNVKSASKASENLFHKKQMAKQKLPKDIVNEKLEEKSLRKEANKSTKKSSNQKPQLQREESSASESGEEEPVKLNEVFTSPVHQKSETSTRQKFTESKMPENVLHALESVGDADRVTLVKTLQHIIDSVKKSEKKRSSAKSSEKIPQQRNCRASASVCSGPEDTEPQMDSDSSSVQHTARKRLKLSHVKNKSNKGACSALRGPHAIVAEGCGKFASRSKACEQDNSPSDSSEDLNSQLKTSSLSGHKIVMPSSTPNVRRTKRIRMRPLEYWRGERVNYAMSPSGGLVINGIICPKTETRKRMKGGHKQKRVEISSELPANLGHVLADASKPTVVVDPETNEEVLLDCVNTDNSDTCFFKDETIEIYKNLNTSTFSTGKLILKPLKEKTHQFVHMDTIVFHVIRGRIIVTLHKTSYYLTTGDYFYVPPGNGYSIHNLVNKECVLLFTQLKD